MAVVPSTDVQGAPAILNHFSSGQTSVDIEFTEMFGETYTGLSVDLPKRSNVLGVTMDLSGGLVEDKHLNRTLSTEEDWSNGTQSPKGHLMYDSRGFHLNAESINPFGDEKEISTGNNSMSVATGDINDDGRMDVVSANMDSDTVSILTQNATGVLKVTTNVTTGDQPRTVDTGDLNGDGRTDFAVGTYGGRSVEIYTANASGGFDKTTIYVGYSVLHLKVADVTDDGREDIILAAYPRYGRVWRQNSNGTFTNIFSQIVTSGGYYYYTYYVRGLAIGDFNDDGRNDIAWTVSTTYTSTWEYQYYGMLKVYLQSSSGTIPSTHTWRWYAYNYAEGIAAGDVNNDNRDDIVFCNRYIKKTRVMTQRSTGSMNSPVALSTRVDLPRFP
ncbi:MAG: VCBS repeat-containing protein, partial [Thermoplasmata archaeon]|nr:VCBS repeat-containing protein [Thermoplasmata archaeon]